MVFCKCRICIDGVLPNLIGVGGQIDLGIGFAIEDAGLLVVEIEQARRRSPSSSKNASSVPTTSAFSFRRWRTRERKPDYALHAIGR